MVNRNLIREFDASDEEFKAARAPLLEGVDPDTIDWVPTSIGAAKTSPSIRSSRARILRVDGDFVLVDVGYKSEGIILPQRVGGRRRPARAGPDDQGPDRRRRGRRSGMVDDRAA